MTVPEIEDKVSIPKNVSYTYSDVNKVLDFPDGAFDLVHMRLLIGGVSMPEPRSGPVICMRALRWRYRV